VTAVLPALRAHPRHVLLGTFVLAFVVGPRWPVLVLPLAMLAVAGAGLRTTPLLALAVLAVTLAGAATGERRLAAFDRFAPATAFGHALRGPVELTGPVQRDRWGGWHAPAVLRGRWTGARVLLRVGAGVRPPAAGTGAVLAVVGGLRPLKPDERYLRVRGIGGALDAGTVVDRGAVRGGMLGEIDGLRRRAQTALRTGVPPAAGALLVGMVLGDASGLTEENAEALKTAGLTHLVAASGANVALLVTFVFAIGVLAGLPQRLRLAVALLAIAAYVPLAGGGPSIQRAGVMGAATVVAVLAGRPGTRWYALLLAAGATLAVNPRAVEDPGWQLSFAAVLAILLAARPLAEALRARGLPGAVAEAGGVTVVATLATAPLLALHFGRLSLVSLPANLVATAAVAPAMWAGFSAAVVGQAVPALAVPLTTLAAVPAGFVLAVGRAAAAVPNASIPARWGAVALGTVAVGALIAVALGARDRPGPRARRRRRAVALGAVALLAALAVRHAVVGATTMAAPDAFQVAFLDVGQGDATLLRHGPSAILVDSGVPDGPVLRRLHELGVERLDVLVMTHAEADHDGGAAAVLDALPVAVLLDGRDGVPDGPGARAAAVAVRRRVRIVPAVAGVALRVGPMTLRVLGPPARDPTLPPDGDPNDRAVVSAVTDGGVVALLPADAESDVTASLALPRAALLKVAHHGSADPGLSALLERVRPQVAVMEVGARNTYGHPAPATSAALERAVPVVARTDRDGTVVVTVHGDRLEVQRHAP